MLFAGTSLYVLAGDLFVPAGMLVNLLSVQLTGAAAYATGGPVQWQDMVYFSFTTLTTLGYGDVTPINSASQSLAVAEALLGVLIVALIIGRLVGAATGEHRRRRQEHDS
ncbi:MAG: potassium channel family protein [Actinobacteria bacterium]|nr:potassium channel family protein [Actinomycetota bacterium]